VPESRAEGAGRGFDAAGAVLVTGGLVALVYAIVRAESAGWGSATVLGFGALALVLLAAFVVVERVQRQPLVRLGIFRTRTLSTANGAMVLIVSGMFATFFFITIYVQRVLGYSPIEAGLAFLPFTAGIIAGSVCAQQLIPRIGVKAQVMLGISLAAVGLLLMSRITADGSYVGQLLPAIIAMSLGMGNTFVPLTLLATTNVGGADAGLASGLFNTSQQVGGALGLAILSTLAASRTEHALEQLGHAPSPFEQAVALVDGYHLGFWIGAAFMVAAVVAIVLLIRRRDVAHVNAEEAVQMAH